MTTEVTKLNQLSAMAIPLKTSGSFFQANKNPEGPTLATTLLSSTHVETVASTIFQIILSMEETSTIMEVLEGHLTEQAQWRSFYSTTLRTVSSPA